MAQRAKKLVFGGLIAGILLGLGIEALRAYAAQALMGVLEDEVRASCPCEFKYDSVALSFIPLTATAENVRLVENGAAALRFEKLHGIFSLRKIRERQILLDELRLINGTAVGVGPESATFKFIDHLAAPIPPERDRPGRWKLKLWGLRLTNSTFTEKVGDGELVATNVGLILERTPGNDFNLRPHAERLVLRRPDRPDLLLGRLALDLFLEDEYVDFRTIELALKEAWVRLSAIAWTGTDDALEGGLSFALDARSLDLPDSITGAVTGAASITGTFGAPELTGSIKNTTPLGLALAAEPAPLFDTFEAAYQCRLDDGAPSVAVRSFRATSRALDVSVERPLTIRRGVVSGDLDVRIDAITHGPVTLRDVRTRLALGGTLGAPAVTVESRLGSVKAGAVEVPDVALNATYRGDTLAVTVHHLSSARGELRGQGSIRFAGANPPHLGSLDLRFTTFRPLPVETSGATPVELTGQASLRGPLTFPGLIGEARFDATIVGTPFQLSGSAEIKERSLHATAATRDDSLRLTLQLDPQAHRGDLEVALRDFRAPLDTEGCSNATVTGRYGFDLRTPETGNGSIDLRRVEVGCRPYTMEIAAPVILQISNGVVAIPRVNLKSAETAITLDGSLSRNGYDLTAQGDLFLNSLLGLAPELDDLQGKLDAAIAIKGPLAAPRFRGGGTLSGAGFALESADLSGDRITGRFELSDDRVLVERVSGALNGGRFEITGEIFPLDLARSSATATFQGVGLRADQTIDLTISGALDLSRGFGSTPLIKGTVDIDSAEFQKQVDLISLMRSIAAAVFSRKQAEAFKRSGAPNIGLDVAVQGRRNIFVVTNWANAELKADVQVRGSLAAPTLEGRVETLTGWFGLKNRRFDLTTGALIFRPTSPEPILDVMGETTIPTRTADTVLVIVEATGPISAPRITLSSDRGLSERDILALLTQGGRSFAQTRANQGDAELETEGLAVLSRYSLLRFHRFVSSLTRIDTVSLAPTYNQRTGFIEPALIAEKKITDRTAIIGETLFGGTTRLKGLYDVTPDLVVSGLIENDPATPNAPLEANLTYTVLARQEPFVELTLRGNRDVSTTALRQALRLSEKSRLLVADIERLAAAAVEVYRNRGYHAATVTVACRREVERYCRALDFTITEGPVSRIDAVRFEGDDPRAALGRAPIDRLNGAITGGIATRETLDDRRKELVRALRSEGYIAARLDTRYEDGATPPARQLVFSVVLGQPVTFVFRGNKAFSAETFLETINLFKRRQPFGNNTIRILTDNIERLYREAGYLYATTRYTRTEDPASGRVTYVVDIVEAGIVPVRGVRLSGNALLPIDEIRTRLATTPGLDVPRMFAPTAAVAEETNANAEAIRSVYIEAGYPYVTVAAAIVPEEAGVFIEYRVVEGAPLVARAITVSGLPTEVPTPELPPSPVSIPQLNRYIDRLIEQLVDVGYRTPLVETSGDHGDGALAVTVTPGDLTRIGVVTVSGNTAIERSTIERNLRFATGERWEVARIDESKRNLLRLGIFSRVTIEPTDGALDSPTEDILVAVSENPLQTLEIGGGLNSEYGLHIFGEGVDRSLFRDGRSLSLRLDTYYDPTEGAISQGIGSFRYADPYFLGSEYTFTEDLRFQRLDRTTQEFDLDRLSLGSSWYRAWENGVSHIFGHTIVSENLNDVSPGAVVGEFDEGTVRLSYLSGALTYDHRDSPIDPRAGYTLALDYRVASTVLGSEAGYYGLGGRASVIQPLPIDRFSVALATHVDSMWTFEDTDEVPISQRLYLGGRNSVRGFRENSLGPRGTDGAVIGGDLLFANNLEARYLATDAVSVHLFLDAGTVFLRKIGVDGDDIRFGAGVGFRFLSPLGPIGFDLGRPLDERSGEPSVRLHFSIGSNF
jgi:outer membrane protein insertion porin family